MRFALLALMSVVVCPSSALAATIPVPGPYPSIQAAIDAASAGDTVLVADSTYSGDGNRDIDFHGKSILVTSAKGPDSCIINSMTADSTGHRGVWFHSGEDTNSILRGFTIINGGTPSEFSHPLPGGGILCDSASSPSVISCNILGNQSGRWDVGGGVACLRASSPLFDSCVFRGNSTSIRGGALASLGGSPQIVDCAVESNIAFEAGAGFYFFNCDFPKIIRCAFVFNGAITGRLHRGPAPPAMSDDVEVYGGGAIMLAADSVASTPQIIDCEFHRNRAQTFGGAIACARVSALIVGCTFDSNYVRDVDFGNAVHGGAISHYGHAMRVDKCLFTGNSARGYQSSGTAVYSGRSYLAEDSTTRAVISRSIFAGNYGSSTEGRIPLSTVTVRGGTVSLEGCTFAGNEATPASVDAADFAATMDSCIMSFTRVGSAFSGGNAVLSCSDLYGNEGGDWVGPIADQWGIRGNISADPLLCSPPNQTYEINQASPCTRANSDCGTLIGAGEVGCGSICGDVNCDGETDLFDLVMLGNLLDHLLIVTPCGECAGDVDGDGDVDDEDYGLLLGNVDIGGCPPAVPEQ